MRNKHLSDKLTRVGNVARSSPIRTRDMKKSGSDER